MNFRRLKINDANAPAIAEVLDRVQGRATAHTFAGAAPIIAAAAVAEARLHALGLTKAQRVGAVAEVRSGGALPRSYKYARVVAKVTLHRATSGWFLISAATAESLEFSAGGTCVRLSPEQDKIAVELFRSAYGRQAPEVSSEPSPTQTGVAAALLKMFNQLKVGGAS